MAASPLSQLCAYHHIVCSASPASVSQTGFPNHLCYPLNSCLNVLAFADFVCVCGCVSLMAHTTLFLMEGGPGVVL